MNWPSDLSLYPTYLHSRLRRGIGLGEGVTYKPWLTVRAVGSQGSSPNIMGIKIPRRFECLSSYETTYLYLLEREPEVLDIQEQFPILDLSATLRICSHLHVKHTRRGRYPDPFTIDFILTRERAKARITQARSIKTPADRAKPGVAQKLNVEYQWSNEIGLDWAVVETDEFTPDLLSSLRFIRRWFEDRFTPNSESAKRFSDAFNRGYEVGTPLSQLVDAAARRSRTKADVALSQFQFCAWSNRIRLDVRRPVGLDHSVVLLP